MSAGDLLAQLERRAERLRSTHPDLDQAIRVQAALTRQRLHSTRAPIVDTFSLPRDRLEGKLGSGTPLLHGEPAVVDVDYAADLFGRMLNALLDLGLEAQGVHLAPLVDALAAGALDAHHLFGEAFVQHRDHLWEAAAKVGVAPDQLITLAMLSVAPALGSYANRLSPMVERTSTSWDPGYCPICGAFAAWAELRAPDWQRHLRCGVCGMAWPSPARRCAFCGNADPATIRRLQLEGESRFGLETCDQCRGYLKTARAFEPAPVELLPFDDLASAHVDAAAEEQDYLRPDAPGFRLELAIPENEWAEDLASMDFD